MVRATSKRLRAPRHPSVLQDHLLGMDRDNLHMAIFFASSLHFTDGILHGDNESETPIGANLGLCLSAVGILSWVDEPPPNLDLSSRLWTSWFIMFLKMCEIGHCCEALEYAIISAIIHLFPELVYSVPLPAVK